MIPSKKKSFSGLKNKKSCCFPRNIYVHFIMKRSAWQDAKFQEKSSFFRISLVRFAQIIHPNAAIGTSILKELLLVCPFSPRKCLLAGCSDLSAAPGHKTDAAYAISTLAYPTGLRCGMMSLSDCAQIHLVEENGYVSRHLSGSVSQQYSDVFPQYSKILQRCHI